MTRTSVYRHYDADGVLLYVGISSNPLRRGFEHACSSDWAVRIARTDYEWFETRADAAAAERNCIRQEFPVANVKGGNTSSNPVTHLLDSWPSRKSLACEIGAETEQVHKWAKFGRIPSGWQAEVVSAAQRRGLEHVTAEWMLDIHSQSKTAA